MGPKQLYGGMLAMISDSHCRNPTFYDIGTSDHLRNDSTPCLEAHTLPLFRVLCYIPDPNQRTRYPKKEGRPP